MTLPSRVLEIMVGPKLPGYTWILIAKTCQRHQNLNFTLLFFLAHTKSPIWMDRTNQDGNFSSSLWDDSAYAQNQVTHRGHTHHVIVTSCHARRGPEALSHAPEAPTASFPGFARSSLAVLTSARIS